MFVIISVMISMTWALASDVVTSRQEPFEPLLIALLYNDTCHYYYTGQTYMMRCGDQCLDYDAKCHCGIDIFYPSEQYCCIPSDETCIKVNENSSINDDPGDVVCSEGKTLSMSSHCNSTDRSLQCHNSYQDSHEIGDWSHYTCPHTCVSVKLGDMCQGVSWCEDDVKECGPSLRCGYNWELRSINSSLAPEHQFCMSTVYGVETANNGQYEIINRSDEDVIQSVGTSYDIDPTLFPPCNFGSELGVTCLAEEEKVFSAPITTGGAKKITKVYIHVMVLL